MSKWSGVIGYSITQENPVGSGIYTESIIEKNYYGDLLSNYRKFQTSSQVNDDVVVSNQISFVADPFALSNLRNIRYVTFMGVKWNIKSVEISYPRINVNIGDPCNIDGGPIYDQ